MSIQLSRNILYTDEFYPNLEDGFISAIDELRKQNKLQAIYILSGSTLLCRHLRRLIAQSGRKYLNLRFTTPLQLVCEAVKYAPPKNTSSQLLLSNNAPPLSAAAKYRASVIASNEFSEDIRLNRVCTKHGFAMALMGLLQDMREELSGRRLEVGHGLSPCLPRAYNTYNELVKQYEDALIVFEAGLEGIPRLFEAQKCHTAIIYGLYNPTPSQERLISALRNVCGLRVFVPSSPTPAYSFAQNTVAYYKRMGFLEPELIQCVPESSVSARLSHNKIAIHACPGEDSEIQIIARRILSEIETDESLRFEHIAILVRTVEPYCRLISETFARLGIPYNTPPYRSLADSFYARGLICLLRLKGANMEFRKVSEFFFEAPIMPERAFMAGIWSQLAFECGVRQGVDDWISAAEMANTPYSSPGNKNAAEELATYIGIINDDISGIPPYARWSEYTQLIIDMASRHLTSDSYGYAEVMELLRDLANLDRMEGLSHGDNLRNEGGFGDVSFQTFLQTLTHSLETTKINDKHAYETTRDHSTGVHVLPIMAARGLSFDVVYIPGLVEKSFPLYREGTSLIRVDDLGQFSHLTRKSSDSETPGEEEMLFAIATNSARKRLILTYPYLDRLSTRERSPSPFLLDIASLVLNRRASYQDLRESILPILTKHNLSSIAPKSSEESLDEREYDLSIMRDYSQHSTQYLSSVHPNLHQPLECLKDRWLKPSIGIWSGFFRLTRCKEAIMATSPTKRSISPTFITDFCQCPFHGYLKHILGLYSCDNTDDEWSITPKHKGSIMHATLLRFHQYLNENGGYPLTPSSVKPFLDTLPQIIDNLASSDEYKRYLGVGVMRSAAIQAILRSISRYIEWEAATRPNSQPILMEAHFGKSSEPPITIYLSNGETISLDGRIDRLDIAPGSVVRVIDYKTGKPRLKDDNINGGLAIQLPIYVIAARAIADSLAIGDCSCSGEYHYIPGDGAINIIRFSDTALKTRQSDILSILEWLVGLFSDCVFPQYPDDDRSNCWYCQYTQVCGTYIHLQIRSKARDPHILTYLDIRGIE